jgi:proline iminopeptidase
MARIGSLLLAAALLAACGARDSDRPESAQAAALTPVDSARLAVPGGSVWYRVVGTGSGTPVVLLHGGPGFSSYYLKSLEALGRPAGGALRSARWRRSDSIADTTLFTIHFVAARPLRHLDLERMHVYGHSWGTILAVEYYRAHPDRVASLVLASPALDIPAWEANARQLLTNLPDSMQRAVREREAVRQYDAPDYQAALGEFYSRYVWRTPVQADLDSLMSTANQGIYMYMQGPSEFTITGTLKQYDATPFLKDLAVPVLFTVGEFDEANPEIVRRHAALVPGAVVTVIPGAAHITAWDNPDANLAAVRSFLRDADTRAGGTH